MQFFDLFYIYSFFVKLLSFYKDFNLKNFFFKKFSLKIALILPHYLTTSMLEIAYIIFSQNN